MSKELENYINELNDAVSVSKSSSKRIFELYIDAYENLTSMEFTKFENGIEMDSSSIRKLKKICENSVLMDNLDALPISWATLYAISTLENKLIIQLINDKKLNSRTTKKEIMEIKAQNAIATPSATVSTIYVTPQSNSNLNFALKDSIDISDPKVISEVNSAIHILEQYFNISDDLLSEFNVFLKEVA